MAAAAEGSQSTELERTLSAAAVRVQSLLSREAAAAEGSSEAHVVRDALRGEIQSLANAVGTAELSVQLLRATRIGNAIGAVARRSVDQESRDRAAALVAEWRAAASKEQSSSATGSTGPGSADSTDSPSSATSSSSENSRKRAAAELQESPAVVPDRAAGQSLEDRLAQLEKAEKELGSENAKRRKTTAAALPPPVGANAQQRIIVRKRLADALVAGAKAVSNPGEVMGEEGLQAVAAECEDELWENRHVADLGQGAGKGSGGVLDEASARRAYPSRARSIMFNLKKNPELAELVATGQKDGRELARMSPQEMATSDLQSERERIKKYATEAAEYREGGNTTRTTLFKCGKCGSRDTEYFLLQTRGADEPMTEFHNCVTCSFRWKC
jgi:transcription elongation factor S-II